MGFYGRATPIGRAACERIDKAVLRLLHGMGHRRMNNHLLLAFAPQAAGGLGFESAYSVARAALCDEINRSLAGHDGEPARR
eukprot:3125009-Prymnesium_polylepis.1